MILSLFFTISRSLIYENYTEKTLQALTPKKEGRGEKGKGTLKKELLVFWPEHKYNSSATKEQLLQEWRAHKEHLRKGGAKHGV